VPDSAGNGAAMRNLPTVLATLEDEIAFDRVSINQAHITHHHPLSDAATLTLGRMTRRMLLNEGIPAARAEAQLLIEFLSEFSFDPWPGQTSGYIVDTVQTVLDAFFTTTSFEECLIKVVNRGGDADTTGALAGQLAGAYYGVDAIPERWLKKLDANIHDAIRGQTTRLLSLRPKPLSNHYTPFRAPPLPMNIFPQKTAVI
jgi:ADP-ribosyl-[dinitrogen reductase] hydrolase